MKHIDEEFMKKVLGVTEVTEDMKIKFEAALEEVSDETLMETALQRVNQPTMSLAEALAQLNFTEEELKEIFDNIPEVELD